MARAIQAGSFHPLNRAPFERGWLAAREYSKQCEEKLQRRLGMRTIKEWQQREEKLREALKAAADDLFHAARILRADGSHQSAKWTEEGEEKARAVLAENGDTND